MIVYFAKMILCTGLFYLGYKWFLEQLSIKKFNRLYQIGSLILPIFLPLFEYKIGAKEGLTPIFEKYPSVIISELTSFETTDANEINSFQTADILLWAYILIATFLVTRKLVNLLNLIRSGDNLSQAKFPDHSLILVESEITPHSFLNKIFIRKDDYEADRVPEEILRHELAHVKQRHSWDIIFFELIQALYWLNPFLIVLGKAIRLNHEFLADNEVVSNTRSRESYQYLLIGLSPMPAQSTLASSVNYSLTKKRLLMMSRTSSGFRICLNQIALFPVILMAVILSCLDLEAQVARQPGSNKRTDTNAVGYYTDTNSARRYAVPPRVPSTTDGVSPEALIKFQEEIDKYKLPDGRYQLQKLAKADRERLEKIYYTMSREQQLSQIVAFIPVSNVPRPKQSPTRKQFEDWKNSKIYGVWLDDRRLDNQSLQNYTRQDIKLFDISKLSKVAVNYGKHYYQVNLYTEKAYQSYATNTRAASGSYMLYGRHEKASHNDPE